MSKVLYLDFDGVLHHEDVRFTKRGVRIGQGQLFEWASILADILRPHPEVELVLSTSWVRIRCFRFARAQLPAELRERVTGATFHSRHMQKLEFAALPRGEQIAQDVFRRGPRSWAAIDDDALHWPSWCRDNLIKTEGATGLSDPVIQHALRVMLERF